MNQQPVARSSHPGALATSLAGVLIILVGMAWLLGNLGFFDARELLQQTWPAILVLLGLGSILTRQHEKIRLGLILIAAGTWAYVTRQGWFTVPFWAVFLPTLTVLVGGSVVWRAFRRPGPEVPLDSAIRIFSVFSGTELRPSLPFEGALLTAVMGGAKLDLRNAPLTQGVAYIDAMILLGGTEIHVPPDWEVTLNVLTFMGGCVDKRSPGLRSPTRRLIINGSVILGGIEVKD